MCHSFLWYLVLICCHFVAPLGKQGAEKQVPENGDSACLCQLSYQHWEWQWCWGGYRITGHYHGACKMSSTLVTAIHLTELHCRYSALLYYQRTESIRYAGTHFQWHISQHTLDSTNVQGWAVPTQCGVAQCILWMRHVGEGSMWFSLSRISWVGCRRGYPLQTRITKYLRIGHVAREKLSHYKPAFLM